VPDSLVKQQKTGNFFKQTSNIAPFKKLCDMMMKTGFLGTSACKATLKA